MYTKARKIAKAGLLACYFTRTVGICLTFAVAMTILGAFNKSTPAGKGKAKMDNWIEDLKEGDTVIIGGRGTGRFSSIGKVSRITKAQVIVGTTKYKKTDGWQVGGDMWSRTFLRKADPAQIQEIKDRQLKMKIVHGLADQDWNKFSLQSLIAIINTVAAEFNKNEGATNGQ